MLVSGGAKRSVATIAIPAFFADAPKACSHISP